MTEDDSRPECVDQAAIPYEPTRFRDRNPAAKTALRMVFLAGVLALIVCLSYPYPPLDRGVATIGLLALCGCAAIILFNVPREAPIIVKDVLVAIFPCLLAAALLGNGLFDASQEVLHQTVVVRTVYGRRSSLIVQSWRPGKSTEALPLRSSFLGQRGFYFHGQSVTVGTRSGALRMPWVTRISR